ncbi:flagellar hook-associated protein FlgL [Legionella waltersii]|uniref:Flagellar hook-associated protein FlgL n=1 Tax=Legionella waltersii TaxID=66969 RepID=A0A0W1AN78_9GAMM|nr:flagellar hook-associated protein FlgL [Legionella waltersii]KTD82712.1 flagellar hook-associated protein FlgL [Legionella waltersii]SNV03415.1 flagellar hook-associated protein 3 FlgL [Legionella waltersii]
MRISTNQIYQRALSHLMNQEQRLASLQQQLSSGIRVQTPSDDPLASAQIELIQQRVNLTEILQKNRQTTQSALQLEEGTIGNATDTLMRLRELQLQAGNPSLSEDARKAIGIEANTILNEMVNFANTKDSNGSYMFSGAMTTTQPVILNGAGQYVYNGDSTIRYQNVTQSLQVATNDTGDNLFMRIPNGNGTFTVKQTATTNTGTASVSAGTAVSGGFTPDTYTMSFALNTQGNLVVMVSGVASGNVIPPTGLPDDAPLYQDGGTVSFNGAQVVVTGAPNAGDAFTISPASNESIFSTIQRVVANLNQPFSTSTQKAAIQTENNQLLTQIDSALGRLVDVRSDLGARLNQLDLADESNNDYLEISQITLKQLREINPTQVATEVNMQLINLQAAQMSFARIQGLSLFNYI